jgi:hypothetical protein
MALERASRFGEEEPSKRRRNNQEKKTDFMFHLYGSNSRQLAASKLFPQRSEYFLIKNSLLRALRASAVQSPSPWEP